MSYFVRSTGSHLTKLNYMADGFCCISVSSMDAACSHGVLRGRPFGGLAVFAHTILGKSVQCVSKSERLLAVRIGNTVAELLVLPLVVVSSNSCGC